MPTFEMRSHYPHPRQEVFAWHTRPGALTRLTPPGWARVVAGPTDGLNVGSTLRLSVSPSVLAAALPGPLRPAVDWRARHTTFEPGELFVDEQVSGPMSYWRHEHHFSDGPGGSTIVTDTVHWRHRLAPARPLVLAQLRALFAFRARQLGADLRLSQVSQAPRTFLVAGASGLVGTQLCAALSALGHRVVRLVRRPATGPDERSWDPARGQLDPEALDGVDVVVNLAGHSIGSRLSTRSKALIRSSRVGATRLLAQALAKAGGQKVLVQASAVGLYGPRRPGELLEEGSPRGQGFLAEVVKDWEQAATPAAEAGVRTVLVRSGTALSLGGGALPRQLPLFLAGAGGRLGPAEAALSWITVDDLARAFAHAALTPLEGPVNAVSPHPVTHAGFASQLGGALRRPALLPTPSLGPKLVLGAEGYDQLIDTDQRVSAEKLLSSGFTFATPRLDQALRHVLVR